MNVIADVFARHASRFERLSSGQLCGHYEGLPKDAAGLYWFRSCYNGRAVKNFRKYGIIDGAIVMELE